MIVNFANTEIHIQHLKIGMVVQGINCSEPYGHLVGFERVSEKSVRVWVQFEQGNYEGSLKRYSVDTTCLDLVGH